jgi:hypothetical protein
MTIGGLKALTMSPEVPPPPALLIGDLRSALALLNLEQDPPEVRVQLILGLTYRAWTLDQSAHEYLAANLRRGLTLSGFLRMFHEALSEETGLIPSVDSHHSPSEKREDQRGTPFTPPRLEGNPALKVLLGPLEPVLKLESENTYPTSLPEDWPSLWSQAQEAARLQDMKDAWNRSRFHFRSPNSLYDALFPVPELPHRLGSFDRLSRLEWKMKGVMAAKCWWALHAPYEPAPKRGGGS